MIVLGRESTCRRYRRRRRFSRSLGEGGSGEGFALERGTDLVAASAAAATAAAAAAAAGSLSARRQIRMLLTLARDVVWSGVFRV